jgi:hypothetical protein
MAVEPLSTLCVNTSTAGMRLLREKEKGQAESTGLIGNGRHCNGTQHPDTQSILSCRAPDFGERNPIFFPLNRKADSSLRSE